MSSEWREVMASSATSSLSTVAPPNVSMTMEFDCDKYTILVRSEPLQMIVGLSAPAIRSYTTAYFWHSLADNLDLEVRKLTVKYAISRQIFFSKF